MVTMPKKRCIINNGVSPAGKRHQLSAKLPASNRIPHIALMRSNRKTFSRFAGSALALTLSAMEILAQSTRVKEAEVISRSGDQWVYTIIFIVLSGLGLAAYLWTRSRKSIGKTNDNFE